MLPIYPIHTSETGAAQWLIKPNTHVGQCYLWRHTSPKAAQHMRTLTARAEGVMYLLLDGLDEQGYPGQPKAQLRRPAMAALSLSQAIGLGFIAGLAVHVPACPSGISAG
jgi:hypothetical protein